MFGRFRSVIDGLAGITLVLALGLVLYLDRPGRVPFMPATSDLQVNLVTESVTRTQAQRMRLAVTPTHRQKDAFTGSSLAWDDMGKLLDDLGEGYRHETVEVAEIARRPDVLDNYDVLFLTCAPGGHELRDALNRFVSRGGTLYASDFRFDAVAAAFPEVVDHRARGSGTVQDVHADVIDPSLREILGPYIDLRFDLSEWKLAAFAGPRVTPLLLGPYQRIRFSGDRVGERAYGPLLVKFTHGKGTVIFTSFHNEKQNSEIEKKLLQYLVFRLVTATLDAEIQQTIEEAGFAPTRSNLLSAPKDQPAVTRSYTAQKTTTLRFALGFRSEGARLRLSLRSPDGRQFNWEGESTLMLEVPRAVAGEWTYTVTALRLPYENFPFTVTIGEKK